MPAAVRNAVWNTFIGPTKGEGFCFCCGCEPILRSNYECGHVVSVADGGLTVLSNLRPVSSLCNKSMGRENMISFALQWGFTSAPILSEQNSEDNIFGTSEFTLEDVYAMN